MILILYLQAREQMILNLQDREQMILYIQDREQIFYISRIENIFHISPG